MKQSTNPLITIKATKYFTIFMAIFLFFLSARAQEMTEVDLEKAKTLLQQEREAIFIKALHLSIAQATVFHPILVEFNKEKRELDDLQIALLIKYSENYEKLDQNIMSDFIKQSTLHHKKELSLRKKYYKEIGKALSMKLASQFYEVDDFISTSLRLNVLMGLPFTNSISKHVTK
jgi:hypothetical protein